jgi:GTPase SAR1 family protein
MVGTAIAASLFLVGPAAAGKSCVAGKIRHRTASDTVSTDTDTLKNVPDTRIRFTQGGNGNGCVVVRFSGVASASDPNWIALRVVMDGNVIGEPGQVQFEGSTFVIARARSFEFVFPNVAPGKHTIVVQWNAFLNAPAYMSDRTTVVQYR